MYTYIKHNIKGFYLPLEDKLDSKSYSNIGTTWDDFIANKFVLLSDGQVKFHEDNPTASVEEVWDMALTPPHERTLDEAKAEMVSKIDQYDSSDAVNSFTLNDSVTAWFTVEERLNYQRSVDAVIKTYGEDADMTFFVEGQGYSIKASDANALLTQLQLYADDAYTVTKHHISVVNSYTTQEEVDNYDYTAGYPEKLSVHVEEEVMREE